MKKKLLAWLLSLACCVGVAFVAACSSEPVATKPPVVDGGANDGGTDSGDGNDGNQDGVGEKPATPSFIYSLEGEEEDRYYSVSGMQDVKGEIAIPASKDGIPVKYVETNAFKDNTEITEVVIPNSVVFIGQNAFSGCTNLRSVTLGEGVRSLEWRAFKDCVSLTSIHIPASVIDTGVGVFLGCEKLAEITVDVNNAFFSSIDGNLYNKDGTTLVQYALGKAQTEFVLPSTVSEISYQAFAGSTLVSVTISEGVRTISATAFENCTALLSVVFVYQDGWTAGAYTFDKSWLADSAKAASMLTGVPVAELDGVSVSTIDWKHTHNYVIPNADKSAHWLECCCGAEGNIRAHDFGVVWLPDTENEEEHYKQCACGMKVTGEHTYTEVAYGEFEHWKLCICLKKGEIEPHDLQTQTNEEYHWTECACGFKSLSSEHSYEKKIDETYHWTECTCGASTEKIEHTMNEKGECASCQAGQGTAGLKYTLSDDETYYVCSGIGTAKTTDIVIKSLHAGLVVKEIASEAFYDCDTLTSVVIPDTVTSIGYRAFGSCSALENVVIGKGMTAIGWAVFTGCMSLKNVVIPDSVKLIGDSAFANCTSLTGVVLPKGLTTLVYRAFYNCDALTEMIVPDSVTSMQNAVFENCDNLERVVLSKRITKIPASTFFKCKNLTSVSFPDTITSIDYCAFYDCKKITSIPIPNGVTAIGEGAFENCTLLTGVVLPEGVITIGNDAFRDCQGLTEINIPASVNRIGAYAFNGCGKITSATFANPKGWFEPYGSALPETALADPATAALYLTDLHDNYAWSRSEE